MPKRSPPLRRYIDYGDEDGPGLTTAEIAALEHVSESMIRNLLARCFKKLRAECQRRNLRYEDVFGAMGE